MSAESRQSLNGSRDSPPREFGSRMSEAETRMRSVELSFAERRIMSPASLRVE
jgi:hypothetical protein